MLIYLGRPIDQATLNSNDLTKLDQLSEALTGRGHDVYHPGRAWTVRTDGGAPGAGVELVNRAALRLADCMVAYWPAHLQSVGLGMEVEAAAATRTPVVVWTDRQSVSLGSRPYVHVTTTLRQTLEAVDRTSVPVRHTGAVRFVVGDGRPAPVRGYPDDAGIDLTVAGDWSVHPGQFVDIHTQVDGVQLPADTWGMITGRSSTLRKYGLHIPVAVIDPGWRGPLYIGVWNLTGDTITVPDGARLAQLICVRNRTADLRLELVGPDGLDQHPRGLNGFGSTGGLKPAS